MTETTDSPTIPASSQLADVPPPPAPRPEGTELVAATWAELGHSVEAVGSRVFLRTDSPRTQTDGGIYLPPELATQYGQRLGSKALVTGTVLSIGPECRLPIKIGDRIMFFRLPFGWTYKLNDDTLVGWIPGDEILGVCEPDAST
jgi:co-chaperonin GroES (HSP10)